MLKFTHIKAIYNVVKHLRVSEERPLPTVQYRGTVKLHGTHAAVECSASELRPMSRERYISIQSDNAGFAVFCSGHRQQASIRAIEARLRILSKANVDDVITIYGEWCGPGIQKGVALNSLKERQFVIFAATKSQKSFEQFEYIEIWPFKNEFADTSIYSIFDAPTWLISINFDDELAYEQALNKVEKITLEVEAQCPYATIFGVTGIGEGIVWTPINEYFGRSDLFWKSKGPKHREVKSKGSKPLMQAEQLASVEAFVEYALTEVRLMKGIDHVKALGKPIEMESTGIFLKWLADDIIRECADELAENSLEWKFAARYINTRAITFWKKAIINNI